MWCAFIKVFVVHLRNTYAHYKDRAQLCGGLFSPSEKWKKIVPANLIELDFIIKKKLGFFKLPKNNFFASYTGALDTGHFFHTSPIQGLNVLDIL